MICKPIIASNNLDSHNETISDSVLYNLAEKITSGDNALGLGLNHDATILPIGKVMSGNVIHLEDGSLGVEAQIDVFIDSFHEILGPGGQNLYQGESVLDQRPFDRAESDLEKMVSVGINPHNFSSEEYATIEDFVQKICNAQIERTIKKSLFPNTEIIIHTAISALALLTAYKTIDKASDKLSDVVSDDIVKTYALIKKIISFIGSRITGKKETTYILTGSDEEVELAVRTPDAKTVLEALEFVSDGNLKDEIDKYQRFFNGSLEKIQFLYNTEDKKWEFNYALTKSGQSIGTEKCYKKAVQLYKDLMRSESVGLSIGGTECK